jgi:hypothetical protein
MTVVIAIIGTITVIALSSQSTFNRSLVLTDTTYSVAFSAREAQSFGSASRAFNTVRNPGYGIHLDKSLPTSYLLFADVANGGSPLPGCPLGTAGTPDAKPGDCRFDSTTDGTVQTFSFGHSFKIKNFCGVNGATKKCSDDSSGALSTLDVTFTRPNTSATMGGRLVDGTTVTFTCTDLTIVDDSGVYTRSLRFSSLGEISVGQTCS